MRFAIHHHITDPEHYDIMIEHNDSLLTWQVSIPDMELLLKEQKINSKRIEDHRKKYISYEGPISCDRGIVKLYDSGEIVSTSQDNKKIEVNVAGNQFKGKLVITHTEIDDYIIEYFPD